ncbi:hypothetical protein [Rhizobium lentis]|uniref:Uncharacterized protein n=1 Tax=Rhizobium lentis TaxID=1138194 RepID=A0A9Q3MDF5_9HYPH|nr:hypothetical protein [Rhizobium lentis]MBX5012547.1 hypothetical protein [Rhizobium lentis]MBX5024146.1 hypothetical protein [Rhizobium lentis]
MAATGFLLMISGLAPAFGSDMESRESWGSFPVSLDSVEIKCPRFGKASSDAALVMECDGSKRTVMIAKSLNFDGASYIRNPDSHAKQVLSDVRKIINEDLNIEHRLLTLCVPSIDNLGRCKTVYVLSGARDFEEAALAINPKDNKIDSFSYFLILSWERGK